MNHGRRHEEQGLLARSRSSSEESYSGDFELDAIEDAKSRSSPSTARPIWWPIRPMRQRHNSKIIKSAHIQYHRPRRRRGLLLRLCRLLSYVPYVFLTLIMVYGAFFPSYSNPPQRYTDLQNRVRASEVGGAANLNSEKIFIAASLYDKEGGLLSGDWGRSVWSLVHILGHDHVFVSVYENDPDDKSREALKEFRDSLSCDSAIVSEHLDVNELPHVTMPDGSQRLQRIAFLAEVRNRALRPLDDAQLEAYHTRWDKLLYLNDIAFDPVDAANLLFNTHLNDDTGRTDYRAACAVDFDNSFKFYDTFATRDLEGYEMGVPFYPWFTNAGKGTGRQDVLHQTDAVRVKSCWGGMVAFEAKWFQPHLYEVVDDDLVVPDTPATDVTEPGMGSGLHESSSSANFQDPNSNVDLAGNSLPRAGTHLSGLTIRSSHLPFVPPLRFRAETDTYWEASECCLINADLAHRSLSGAVGTASGSVNGDPGIYMNPYVRVAYSQSVLRWLSFTKRFERLYPFVHNVINFIGDRPGINPRRLEQPGDEVINRVWQWDVESLAALRNGTVGELANGLQGAFHDVSRKAQPGQFCGSRKLLYFKDHRDEGDSPWSHGKVPFDDD